jgi:hypothetical protein
MSLQYLKTEIKEEIKELHQSLNINYIVIRFKRIYNF